MINTTDNTNKINDQSKLKYFKNKKYGIDEIINKINKSKVKIEQSPNDNREYLGFELQNGMKVIVISDKNAEKSAASLDINVGQLQDIEGYEGLAHFCEHMLFMGTKKYPQQNDYSQYLSQNGGSDNAYTDMLNTNYYFDVKSCAFEGALDRFSQFFIHPLFDETSVEKEINAIENEHQMNASEDSTRLWCVFKALAKEGTKFRNYGGGCFATLQKCDIRDKLLEFYNKYYSAHKMNLVIYGKESIQQLQTYAVQYFSDVIDKSNLKIEEETNNDINKEEMHPFGKEQLSKLIKIIPIKDEDSIEFSWVVEDQRKNYKIKADDYLQHVFGHEGKNSLLSLLIDEGLAVDLTSYSENCMNLFTIIGFNITLTSKGFQEYKSVCHAVFNYIEILKKDVVNEDAYQEIKDIEAINFRFLERIPISDYVTKIADELHSYPMSDVLKARYDFVTYDANVIQNLINSLTIDNILIYLSSKSFDSSFSKSFNTSQQDFDLIIDSSTILNKKLESYDVIIEDITHCHNHAITHPHGAAGALKAKKVKENKKESKINSNDISETNQSETKQHGSESPKLKSPLSIPKKYKKKDFTKTYTIEEGDELDHDLELTPLSISNTTTDDIKSDQLHLFKLDNDNNHHHSHHHHHNHKENNHHNKTDDDNDDGQSSQNSDENNSQEESLFLTEKYLGAKYLVEDIPEDIRANQFIQYRPIYSKKKLGLPVKNIFIPKNFTILPYIQQDNNQNSEEQDEQQQQRQSKVVYPKLVYSSEMSELYYKQDDTFKICKTLCDLFIYTNDCNQSKTAKSYILQELWIMLFENYVNETKYLASMAHIDLKFEQHYTSFKVRIKGYSDTFGTLFEQFLILFQQFSPVLEGEQDGQRIFLIFYEKLLSEYDNYYRDPPHSIITDLSKNCMLSTGKFSVKQKIMALKDISFSDLLEFHKQWLSHTRLESLIMGNITQNQAISWIQKAETTMKNLRTDFAILQKTEIPLIRTNKIASNTYNLLQFYINEKEFNPEETNSCLLSHYQSGAESAESRVMMKLLQNYISEPLFDQLRTNEKLGYIVWCWDETFRGVSGFTFVIQSSLFSPMHIQNRLDEFLKNIKKSIRSLSQEKFDNMKHSILVKLTESPKTLHREFTLMQEEILLHKFIFDRRERIKDILDNIKIEDMRMEFERLFFEERKKVEIHIVCKDHNEEQQRLLKEHQKTQNIFILQDDTHLRQYSQQNESLYYDFSSPIQMPI